MARISYPFKQVLVKFVGTHAEYDRIDATSVWSIEEAEMTLDRTLRPIRSEADFEAALREYETYFDNEPKPDTEAAYRFEVLGLLLAKYEEDHYPIPPQDPVEALTQVMETKGKTQSDLAAIIGAPRASEVLSRKRSLSIEQVRQIRSRWGVPADVLI